MERAELGVQDHPQLHSKFWGQPGLHELKKKIQSVSKFQSSIKVEIKQKFAWIRSLIKKKVLLVCYAYACFSCSFLDVDFGEIIIINLFVCNFSPKDLWKHNEVLQGQVLWLY